MSSNFGRQLSANSGLSNEAIKMNKISILFFIGILVSGVANSEMVDHRNEKDWSAAAKFSLTRFEIRQKRILVVGENLSVDAQNALKHWRKTILVSERPELEKYGLPPGNYLRVNTFEKHGNVFEFSATSGPVAKEANLSCGMTLHFFIKRKAGDLWVQSGPMQTTVC